MSVFWQSVLAVFAAVGFYTVLHVVYERICAHLLRQHGSAELTLYGDGCDRRASSSSERRCACGGSTCRRVDYVHRAWQRSGAEYREVSRRAAGHHVSGIAKTGKDGALWTKKNM